MKESQDWLGLLALLFLVGHSWIKIEFFTKIWKIHKSDLNNIWWFWCLHKALLFLYLSIWIDSKLVCMASSYYTGTRIKQQKLFHCLHSGWEIEPGPSRVVAKCATIHYTIPHTFSSFINPQFWIYLWNVNH